MVLAYSFLKEPRHSFFQEQDPVQAWKLLKPFLAQQKSFSEPERRALVELAGLVLRSQRKFDEAFKLYKELGDEYQSGYCLLMMGKINDVRTIWSKLVEKRQNHWAASLYGMVTHQVNLYPTLLQIRNQLECDVMNLIHAEQYVFLENLLVYADFLAQLNMEAYKFLGRALMYSGRLDQAHDYLMKGQKILPNDPEIYFHLGQYSFQRHLYKDAKLVLNQCLLISPTYTPARDLLTLINES
ncbi:MAG: hypothetical protein K2X66_11495 [Cyanobacteria bacterium]|nr:hypothetical protein [Cyanobacteriota bacterium]